MNLEDKKLIAQQKRQKYYLDNKEKINQRNNANYQKNKDAILLKHKKRLEDEDVAIKDKERQKQYRLDDPEKQRIKSNNYYKNNKEIVSARTSKRRAILLTNTPSWFDSIKSSIDGIYAMRDWMNLTMFGIKYEVDHIIPLTNKFVCGLHVPNNLQIITQYNNRSKQNKFKE
jgi:hypothetical protein